MAHTFRERADSSRTGRIASDPGIEVGADVTEALEARTVRRFRRRDNTGSSSLLGRLGTIMADWVSKVKTRKRIEVYYISLVTSKREDYEQTK
jgi:hypothetical protein